jgi:hypothetical protein
MSEQTTQEAYLAEMLGDVYKIRKESEASLQDIKKMRAAIAESFVGVETSISNMDLQIEESISNSGKRISATLTKNLDVILQQTSIYQANCLNKIREFFIGEAEKNRTEQGEIAKKEIEDATQNATKEIASLIHRINGNKLETKLIFYTLVFALSSSLITCSITYVIIKNHYASAYSQPVENSATTPKQKR